MKVNMFTDKKLKVSNKCIINLPLKIYMLGSSSSR